MRRYLTRRGGQPERARFENTERMDLDQQGRVAIRAAGGKSFFASTVKQPVDGLLLSNSMPAAVTGLAPTLANEYVRFGISVNNVCPGYTHTARLDTLAKSISTRRSVKPEGVFAGWTRQIPAGRINTPEVFAVVVAFLASQPVDCIEAGSGTVDGGLLRSLH